MLDTGKHTNHEGQRPETGEAFWPKRAWRSRRVRFLRFFAAAGNLPLQDTKLTPKRDPNQHPGPPKRPPKRQPSTPRPQTDTQKGPQISTPGLRSTSTPPTEVATQRWQPHTAQLPLIIIIRIIIIIMVVKNTSTSTNTSTNTSTSTSTMMVCGGTRAAFRIRRTLFDSQSSWRAG